MGSNTSKTSNDTAVPSKKNDSEKDIGGNSDPRSPTPEIARTPLQNKNGGGKHNITKNVDLRKTFENGKTEEKLIHNNPILSAVIKNHLQSYDPRSPTQDFERTPIIIGPIDECVDKQTLREQIASDCGSPGLGNSTIENNYNDSLDAKLNSEHILPKNLCNGFYDMTLNDSIKEQEEPLGSSTASNDAIEGNISNEIKSNKPSKLLETNFEYVENEQDKFEDSIEEATEIKEVNLDVDIKNVPLFKILNEDPRSPSMGIERTPIVVAKIEDNDNEENVEQMSDDTLIKVLQNTNAELRQNIPQEINNDGILIYEDESNHLTQDTPKKSKSTNNSGSRTPLSCMKNKTDASHTRSKSANMLYDPKNQNVNSKQHKRVSHIPRLKSLNKQTKYFQTGSTISLKNISKSGISGDCENTPPQSHRDKWDKDNSIVL